MNSFRVFGGLCPSVLCVGGFGVHGSLRGTVGEFYHAELQQSGNSKDYGLYLEHDQKLPERSVFEAGDFWQEWFAVAEKGKG
jgi:hypothetical protein